MIKPCSLPCNVICCLPEQGVRLLSWWSNKQSWQLMCQEDALGRAIWLDPYLASPDDVFAKEEIWSISVEPNLAGHNGFEQVSGEGAVSVFSQSITTMAPKGQGGGLSTPKPLPISELQEVILHQFCSISKWQPFYSNFHCTRNNDSPVHWPCCNHNASLFELAIQSW